MDRRNFLENTSIYSAGFFAGSNRLTQEDSFKILNPRDRVPINFIIDDSTALVNLAHFGIPQFKEVFPDKYLQDWKKLPREIPDSFVLEFLGWCADKGVKGKYSMVPYPACTGWLNRFIPGWSKKELEASLEVVRKHATPDWDIHSEMISHTRVIDIKTGLPYREATPDFMENWEWSQKKSADELGEYIAYSLQILKDVGFDCDGVTTPGGFGSRNISNLALGTKRAVAEVFGHGVSHFFRDLILEPGKSVQPQVMHVENIDSDHASCSVHMIGCTGDWFGGWDGLTPGDADRFITEDGSSGRLVEVIGAEEPALLVCHWPGIYYNGEKIGFNIFKTVVNRLNQYYDNLHWMKLTDIASYWAAKEHTKIRKVSSGIELHAPFACKDFTFSSALETSKPVLVFAGETKALDRVANKSELTANTWTFEKGLNYYCVNLSVGQNLLRGV